MSLATRAMAAAQEDERVRAAAADAKEAELRAHAVNAILRAAEPLDIEIAPDAIERESAHSPRFVATVPVTADATLRFAFPSRDDDARSRASVRVIPADQLYYDLPAGIERIADRETRGYTYGCYGLIDHASKEAGLPGSTLARIGQSLARIERAREQWQCKQRKYAAEESL